MRRTDPPDRAEERRQQHQRAARLGIMLAAARVVGQQGYRATTMRAIAKESGYTASSLYTYFASKEEIFSTLREEVLDRVQEVLEEEIPEGLDFPACMALLLHRFSRLFEDYHDALVLHVASPLAIPEDGEGQHYERMRRIDEMTRRFFQRYASPADLQGHSPAEAATIYQSLQRGFLERALFDTEGRLEPPALKAAQARALTFFLAALAAPPAP